MLVRAGNLTVDNGRKRVLDGVSIEIRQGEIVTLIGPNGSGKTTLVRALLGTVPAAAGDVRRADGLRIGYMPQTLAVDPTLPLSVDRFLAMSGEKDRARRDAVLAEVGADRVAGQQLTSLSGGELKRVMLARALLRRPDLLVLDEPTANVDVHGQTAFYDLVGRIRDRRACGILLVSHDLHLVMAATDVVVCLNGHVCCSGAPADVTAHPEYLSLFGEPAAAVAVYTHDHDHHHDMAGEPHPDHGAR